jgi:hypothetical protein
VSISFSIFSDCNFCSVLIGKGCVFTYDAVGSYERTGYSAQGTGATLITPILDNKLKSPSPLILPARVRSSTKFPLLNAPTRSSVGLAMANLKCKAQETRIFVYCL